MSYSNATVIINSISFYVIVILGAVYIWRTSMEEREDGSLVKLIGYTFLSAFKFSLNNFPVPLGFIIAYFIRTKAKVNKEAKKRAMVIGVVLFGVGLLPLNDYVENILYPRNSIKTYLSEERKENQKGFNFTLIDNKSDLILRSYSHTDDIGKRLYKELASIKNIDNIPFNVEWKYQINFVQDTNSERFRQLDFDVTEDGKLLQLIYEEKFYYFKGNVDFQSLFSEIIDDINH